jgi:hypothetical protein
MTTSAGTDQTGYCRQCGQPVDGTYCAQCGTPVAPTISMPAAGAPQTSGPARSRPSRTGALLAAAALGVAAIAVAVILIATGSSSKNTNSASTGYQTKLSAALVPVIAANAKLSAALSAIDGSRSTITASTNAANDAQSAVTAARGAVGELAAPASEGTLSQQVSQALTQDTGYLQAVTSTLSNPSGTGPNQLQSLATNTQSAFVPLNGVVSSASSSVSGTGNLLSWDSSAVKTGKAVKKTAVGHPPPTSSTVTQTSTTVVGGSSSTGGDEGLDGTACSTRGVSVNASTTSCGFAENVEENYFGDGNSGGSASVTASSPATGKTYVMDCEPDNDGNVTCTGAINASLTFSG